MLWLYFTLGHLLLFFPQLVAARVWAGDREAAFQRINSRFFHSFLRLTAWLIPGLRIEVPPEVRTLRGAVIVCNHASYLDPLLLIALFERHKTIVKGRFFRLPIFGWVLDQAGYLPAGATDADQEAALMNQVEGLPAFFASGGNLFVFPEGTRNPTGRLGAFGTGAFRIARRCGVPLALLYIRGSAALFQPGRFRFATGLVHRVRIEPVARLLPNGPQGHPSALLLRDRARELLGQHAAAQFSRPPSVSDSKCDP